MRSVVLIVATLGLMPVMSRAQESGGAVACPSIQNDQERLACYDRAMRGGARPPQPAETAAPASASATAPAPVLAPAPAPTPAPPPANAAAPAVGAAAVGAAAATATPPASSSVAAPAAAATAAPTAATSSSSTISTSQHTPRNTTAASPPQPATPPTFDPNTGAPTGILPVVVLSALVRPGFGTEFMTDTAGVWIQTETKPLTTLPKPPFNAQLQPGKFGSTFLVLPDRKMGIRVRPPNK